MGTKAFLQKGRTRPGIVLPANAVARVNQADDRSALVRAAEKKAQAMTEQAEPLPNIGTSIAAKARATLSVSAQVDVVTPSEPEPASEPAPALPAAEPEPEPVPMAPEPEPEPVPATPEPEPEPEPTPEEEPAEDEAKATDEDLALTVVGGIGAALAERFATYGYRTLADLAKAQADSINQIPGARQRGRQWIDEARKRLGLL